MSQPDQSASALLTENQRLREALGLIAGEWHARRLPDGERFGCSCPEFAREALDKPAFDEENRRG